MPSRCSPSPREASYAARSSRASGTSPRWCRAEILPLRVVAAGRLLHVRARPVPPSSRRPCWPSRRPLREQAREPRSRTGHDGRDLLSLGPLADCGGCWRVALGDRRIGPRLHLPAPRRVPSRTRVRSAMPLRLTALYLLNSARRPCHVVLEDRERPPTTGESFLLLFNSAS